uniref:Uncharacterized protein n=1 Tax=Glossina pallidipes TaxID=7398 RepID=A0A1A9Z526_GLOPL
MLEPSHVTRGLVLNREGKSHPGREAPHTEPTILIEENDTIDDVVIIIEEKGPITIRAMTLINQSKATTLGTLIDHSSQEELDQTRHVAECPKPSADSKGEEPSCLGTIVINNTIDEIDLIKPIIKLFGNTLHLPRLELRAADRWIALNEDDP